MCALILGQQYFKGSGIVENYGKQCTQIFFFLLIDTLSVNWPWQVILKMRLKVPKSLNPLDKVKKGLNKAKIFLHFSILSEINPKPFFCKTTLTGDFCYTRILLIAINFVGANHNLSVQSRAVLIGYYYSSPENRQRRAILIDCSLELLGSPRH